MLYYFLKRPLRYASFVFFKKLYISNQERIPSDVPCIFAVNHPTAFIDPVLLGSHIDPTVHFIVRGDIFSSKLVRFLLDQINMIPIFRARDGFSKLRDNKGTMDLVYKKISEGQNIVILAEGQTKHEKKMRPIQKGAARMLFGAYDKFGRKDMVVIPVGVNYTDSDRFRSKVMIDIGDPIPMANYLDQYEKEPRIAINQYTQKISEGMLERIIHVEENDREKSASKLMEIAGSNQLEKLLPLAERGEASLFRDKKIADEVNQLSAASFGKLNSTAEEYESLLNALALSDQSVAQSFQNNFKNIAILIIGLVPFLVGYALNALPLFLARIFADKKVKKIEFHSSVRFAGGFFLYLIYFLILAIVLFNVGFAWWMILAIPFLGWFALFWRDLFLLWNGARAFQALPASTREEILELRGDLEKYLPE